MRPPDIRVEGGPRRWAPDPLAICEWCFQPVADPYAPCERDDCRAKTSQLDAAIAVAVAEELDS